MNFKSKKFIILSISGAISLILILVLLFGGKSPSTPPPDPNSLSKEQLANYLASNDFGRLSPSEKNNFLKSLNNGEGGRRQIFTTIRNLSDKERRKAFSNMREAMREAMDERMEAYFKLPQEERTAYLDEMIDRMKERRERRKEREKASAPGNSGGRSGESARDKPREDNRARGTERRKDRIESSNPEQRARRAEFFKDLRKRAQERGVSMGGPGRRGR